MRPTPARAPRDRHPDALPHPLHHLHPIPAEPDRAHLCPSAERSAAHTRPNGRTQTGARTRQHPAALPAPEITNNPAPSSSHVPDPLLFTPEQAAELLAVKSSWLRRAAGEGRVSAVMIGKHLRFTRQDLDELIARGHRPGHTT